MFLRAICFRFVVVFFVLCCFFGIEGRLYGGQRYEGDLESLKRHNAVPDWFRDAKFGIYFHWGVYTVPAFGTEWYPREIAIEDLEKGRMNQITDYVWLTDDTISFRSWSYVEGMKIKSTRYLLGVLIDIVSKNGCLLLNISPKSDGTIPKDQQEVLLGIGAWLDKHGEAIYSTRPFVVFGEGPTRLTKGGEYARELLNYTPEDIRFTTKGDIVYAIQMGWPGANHETLLKSFKKELRKDSLSIKSVEMLGSKEKIAWSLGEEGLTVTSPASLPHDMAVVYKIETNGLEHFRDIENKKE